MIHTSFFIRSLSFPRCDLRAVLAKVPFTNACARFIRDACIVLALVSSHWLTCIRSRRSSCRASLCIDGRLGSSLCGSGLSNMRVGRRNGGARRRGGNSEAAIMTSCVTRIHELRQLRSGRGQVLLEGKDSAASDSKPVHGGHLPTSRVQRGSLPVQCA